VELGSIGDPALVCQAVAAALHVPEEHGLPLVERLKKLVSARRLLLLLDNCEHLLPACADLVDTLVRAGPEIRIVTTSREAFRIAGETVWRVAPLVLPTSNRRAALDELERSEAVSLFLVRARATQPAFSFTDENATAVVELCRRLDGIPLAIELTAATVGFLSPAQILVRLEDRHAVLSSGARNAPPRQQSLAATIEWSCGLLSEAELRVFARLSTFAGSLSLEAAEAVCAGEGIDPHDVVDLVGRLVSKSLVVVEALPGGQMDYPVLEILRAFGRRILQASGDRPKRSDTGMQPITCIWRHGRWTRERRQAGRTS
jgi:non-specific serine/threonine protein kinase